MMLGDSRTDVLAAGASGVRCVGFARSNHKKRELARVGGSELLMIASLADLQPTATVQPD